METYYGKYRGTVRCNVDPKNLGRIQVDVPGVSNAYSTSWALPCLPFVGVQMGIYTVPPRDAPVWVEFEQGDPAYPIWSGCFWDEGTPPPPLALSVPPTIQQVLLQTNDNTLFVSDVPGPEGGILIKNSSGAMIKIDSTGITIDNGQQATIVMTGGNTILLNGDALQIT